MDPDNCQPSCKYAGTEVGTRYLLQCRSIKFPEEGWRDGDSWGFKATILTEEKAREYLERTLKHFDGSLEYRILKITSEVLFKGKKLPPESEPSALEKANIDLGKIYTGELQPKIIREDLGHGAFSIYMIDAKTGRRI